MYLLIEKNSDSIHRFLLSVVFNLSIFVCMGFNAIINTFLGHFKGSQSFKDLPRCNNQSFHQIFASSFPT